MAAMSKVLAPRKKVKKTFSRRLHSGYAAAPSSDFFAFKDYARTEIDKKETAKVIREYIRKNFSKAEADVMLQAPEWCFTMPYHIGATIVWLNYGNLLPSTWDDKNLFNKFFAEVKRYGEKKAPDSDEELEEGEPTKKRTIADIVTERSSEFISDVEGVLDEFYAGYIIDIPNYSPYLELKKIDAPYNVAKKCHDYYVPLLNEIKNLLAKGDKDLEEGYRHMSPTKRKDYLKLVSVIVSDCDKYMQSKKAVRKIRIARPITADKQIKSVNYLKESPEFKLTSINPITIVGKQRLYTFDVTSRMLCEYVSSRLAGFEIKGTSLLHVDLEKSRQTRLRKPEEFLQVVLKQTPLKIDTEWKKLTTKTNSPNSRINIHMVLLRTLDK